MVINPRLKKAAFIIFIVLFLDQLLKVWIKTTFYMGESHAIFGHWFYLHFTENEGMAFGMKLGGNYGKLLLSLFRVVGGYYVIFMSPWSKYKTPKPKAAKADERN